MLIRRTNGSFPMARLRNEVDRVFGDFYETLAAGNPLSVMGRREFPAVNVWEDDQSLYAEAELPGLTMDDLEVFVLGDELTIKGKRPEEDTADVTHHRRERGVGSFSRVLRLPVQVDAEKVEATLRDGVLSLTMPKPQAVLPRKIEVKS